LENKITYRHQYIHKIPRQVRMSLKRISIWWWVLLSGEGGLHFLQ